MQLYRDRADAGRRLAQHLDSLRGEDPVVLGLPRGGVPVAYEVAKALANAIAVGDAENDLALLLSAEVRAAVANAVPPVRERADLVLEAENGDGVNGLLTGPYLTGAQRLCPNRRWIDIGTFDDGSQIDCGPRRRRVANVTGSHTRPGPRRTGIDLGGPVGGTRGRRSGAHTNPVDRRNRRQVSRFLAVVLGPKVARTGPNGPTPQVVGVIASNRLESQLCR